MNVDKANAALDSVYTADTPETLAQAYAAWAATYDSETASLGYLLPFLITAWVARHVPAGEGPLLDAGCGTGLSGPSLKALGYGDIAGLDLSDDMLKIAGSRNAYGELKQAMLGGPLPWPDGHFPRLLLDRRVHHQPCAGFRPARTGARHEERRPRHLHRARPGVRERWFPGRLRRAGTDGKMAADGAKPVVPLLCDCRAGCAGEDVCLRGALNRGSAKLGAHPPEAWTRGRGTQVPRSHRQLPKSQNIAIYPAMEELFGDPAYKGFVLQDRKRLPSRFSARVCGAPTSRLTRAD